MNKHENQKRSVTLACNSLSASASFMVAMQTSDSKAAAAWGMVLTVNVENRVHFG